MIRPGSSDSSEIPRARIEDALDRIERWQGENHCPGTSVAVVDGGEIVASAGFGTRKLDPDEPATGSTRYAVGSVTKPITALATVLLTDRYGIDQDDPVSEYVPYFADVPGDPITVHQLLTHTSGMPDDDLAFVCEEVTEWETFREFLADTTDRRLVDRTRWLYYNSGYAVLSRLIEEVSETSFPAFVETELFEPLGMEHSTFDHQVLGHREADVMAAYTFDDEQFHEETPVENGVVSNEVLKGSGGLISSVEDLAKFVAFNLDVDLAVDHGIDPDLLRRTRESVETRRELVDGTRYAYAYGWELQPFGSDTLVGHAGNAVFSAGYAGFLRERGIGIALGCNARPAANPADLAREVLATLSGEDPASVDHVRSIRQRVRGLAGRYESHTGSHVATVQWADPHIEFSIGGADVEVEREYLLTTAESDRYRFTSTEHVESTTDLEIFESDGAVELLFDQVLFRRVEDD